MTRAEMKRNAQSNIDQQKKLAREGKDFSAGTIVESERIIEIADMPFTDAEIDRLRQLKMLPRPVWENANDIKEKYDLSWSELKMVAMLERENLNDIRSIRAYTKLTQAGFAQKYGIPKRSIENWEGGKSSAPDYLVKLLARVVKEDF